MALGTLLNSWHTRLGVKFAVLVAGILLIALGINAVLEYQDRRAVLLGKLHARGELLGRFVASVSPQPILSYDHATLDDYVRQISRQDEIVYAVILSPDRKHLTSFLDETDPDIGAAVAQIGHNNVPTVIAWLRTHPNIVPMEFPIDFNGRRLGSVAIGFSRESVDRLARGQLLNEMLVGLTIVLLVGLSIFVVFRHYALRPLRALTDASEQITNGNLEHRVQIQSRDELGELATTFNRMTLNLRQSTAEKDAALAQHQDLNRHLESRVAERTQELVVLNRELLHLANHDPLTGLPNRILLQERLREAITAANRERNTLAIVMIDLDQFKEINDTLGHQTGDQLLKDVAVRLRAILREHDTVGRLGGDEFGFVLPGANEGNAVNVANKVLEALTPPFTLEGLQFSLGASLGIALYPQHGVDEAALLRRADVAMYVAKSQRTGYCLYRPEQDLRSADRLALMAELHDAIDAGQLIVHYQPILDLKTNQFVAVEALSRWPHPQRGLITPDQFIPLVEQSELIKPFTAWVMRTAVSQWAAWRATGRRLRVNINLSMRNLHDPDLPRQLSLLLRQHDMAHEHLVVEITENALMHDPHHVQEVLAHISALGVHIAIDDFGTGYSSLSHLKKLAVDELKIDRGFVRDMLTDKDDAAIVRSTIDLAHNLGRRVVAEGVENRETLDRLRELGCDYAQGDLLGRPAPVDELLWLGKLPSLATASRRPDRPAR